MSLQKDALAVRENAYAPYSNFKVGAAIRAGFEFDVPVRFESDQLDLLMDHPGQIQAGQIRLIEVRL